jgi:hypothetical protein
LITKRKKATSLIEVVVVLAIISITIIASMTLVVKANVSIKNNELIDSANNILLEALEFSKSPGKARYKSPLDILNLSAGLNNTYYFSYNKDSTGSFLKYEIDGAAALTSFDDCVAYPVYKINTVPFTLCLQVQIIPRPLLTSKYYEINVAIAYDLNGRRVTDNLKTYRYNDFQQEIP